MRHRYRSLRSRLSTELKKAFEEDHTPREVGLSFAFGIFLTVIPTLGLGLVVFLILIRLSDRVSSLALMSTVIVVNPVVKPVFHLAGISLGGFITGKTISENLDPVNLLIMLYTGSFVLAVFLSVISYFIVVKAVRKYREKELHTLKDLEQEVITRIEPEE